MCYAIIFILTRNKVANVHKNKNYATISTDHYCFLVAKKNKNKMREIRTKTQPNQPEVNNITQKRWPQIMRLKVL